MEVDCHCSDHAACGTKVVCLGLVVVWVGEEGHRIDQDVAVWGSGYARLDSHIASAAEEAADHPYKKLWRVEMDGAEARVGGVAWVEVEAAGVWTSLVAA
jgi:hypothetical protein